MLPQKKKRRKRKRKKKRSSTKIGAKLKTGLALFAATPALAVFCSGRCDASAYLCARRATGLPLKVAREQRAAAAGRRTHRARKRRGPRTGRAKPGSWCSYGRHGRHGRRLVSPRPSRRAGAARIGQVGARHARMRRRCADRVRRSRRLSTAASSRYSPASGTEQRPARAPPRAARATGSAFRGGDGGTEDAKTHPGSPAWAFVQGEKAERVPAEVRKLASGAEPRRPSRGIRRAAARARSGYCSGRCPPWLRTSAGPRGVASTCTLLSAATAFWPYWLWCPAGRLSCRRTGGTRRALAWSPGRSGTTRSASPSPRPGCGRRRCLAPSCCRAQRGAGARAQVVQAGEGEGVWMGGCVPAKLRILLLL